MVRDLVLGIFEGFPWFNAWWWAVGDLRPILERNKISRDLQEFFGKFLAACGWAYPKVSL